MKITTGLGAISLLLLAACSVKEDTGNESASGTDAAEQDMTPEGPSMISRLIGGGEPMPLDVQTAHPNGVVLQVNSIQAKPMETVLNVTISNGDDREQTLNRSNAKNDYIVGSDGTKLYLSPPTNNPNLQIPAGQRVEAELVFLGRLTSGGPATLILNDGSGADNKYTNYPGFRIALPIEDAAFSDDGSKKN